MVSQTSAQVRKESEPRRTRLGSTVSSRKIISTSDQGIRSGPAIAPKSEPKGAPKSIAGRVPFPRNSLTESLAVSQAIWKENAGEPFDPILLAKSLGTTHRSSQFFTLATSSERYGLTDGNVKAKAIAITDLAKEIVAPTEDGSRGTALRKALLTPKIFEQLYNGYNRQNIPREENVKAKMERQLGVPRADLDACYDIFMRNIKDYGLAIQTGESNVLFLDNLGKTTASPESKEGEEFPQLDEGKKEFGVLHEQPSTRTSSLVPATVVVKVPSVFISHSKNKNILSQIKQMLDFGKFQSVIAEEKETTAMPISDKVFDLMWECNCAIINISADAEKKQGETFGINENVIAELWGAYLHYKKRVILVIDKRLKDKLPSILQGLTAIFYEGDELSWGDGMRLQKALSEFRNQLLKD